MWHTLEVSHTVGASFENDNAPPIGRALSFMLVVFLDIVQEELRSYTQQYYEDAGDDEQDAIAGGDW